MSKIQFKDLETIEVTTNKKVLKQIPVLADKISSILEVKTQDVLFVIGLSSGKFTKEQTKLANEYALLTKEHEKQLFLNGNKNISLNQIEEINKIKTDIFEKIQNLPSNLAKLLVLNENETLYDDLINLLVLATDKTKEDLEETDVFILIEVFAKLFVKPSKDLEKALFLNNLLSVAKEMIQSLGFMKAGKKLITSIKAN